VGEKKKTSKMVLLVKTRLKGNGSAVILFLFIIVWVHRWPKDDDAYLIEERDLIESRTVYTSRCCLFAVTKHEVYYNDDHCQ
jgi:hypothetical protein